MALRWGWLHGLGPSLKCSYAHKSFIFEANGSNVLLLGEKDVPTCPLICTAEFVKISLNNDIELFFFLLNVSCIYFDKFFMNVMIVQVHST